MNCPVCNQPTLQHIGAHDQLERYCDHCGWGREQAFGSTETGEATEASQGLSASDWTKLVLLWVLTTVVVFGPLAGLIYLRKQLFGDTLLFLDVEGPGWLERIELHYWWLLAVYLIVCWTLNPSPDRDRMGVHGLGSLRPMAITPEHHANQFLATLSALVAPGKIVLHTVAITWRVLRR